MRQLEVLAERLLREGVAYRHVKRFIGELRDHYDDAVRSERARGASDDAAHAAAVSRLGAVDDLAGGIIARPELRAFSARHPRLWGSLAPAALWLIFMTSIMLLLIAATKVFEILESGSANLAPFQGLADAFMFVYTRGVPVAIGAGIVWLALRQRIDLTWPLAGLAVLAALAATSDAALHFAASPDVRGEMRFGVGFSRSQTPEVLLRLFGMLALMLAPLLLRKRLTPPLA